MARTDMVILEEDHARFTSMLDGLREDANASLVFLLDKNGQQIAQTGELNDVDPTSLASLTAGAVAATEGLAQSIGEADFSTLFHEGQKDHLHLSVIADKVILLVIFDERSSLGLVRLRVEKVMKGLASVVSQVLSRTDGESAAAVAVAASLSEITDEDVDALFG